MLEKDICQELNNSKSKARDRLDSGGWPGSRGRMSQDWTWTNFHCALCLGVAGFFIFWIFLLARMYLPMENALMAWWLGKDSEEGSLETTMETIIETTMETEVTSEQSY